MFLPQIKEYSLQKTKEITGLDSEAIIRLAISGEISLYWRVPRLSLKMTLQTEDEKGNHTDKLGKNEKSIRILLPLHFLEASLDKGLDNNLNKLGNFECTDSDIISEFRNHPLNSSLPKGEAKLAYLWPDKPLSFNEMNIDITADDVKKLAFIQKKAEIGSQDMKITPADYQKWVKADLWTVERAISLLINAETFPSSNYGSSGQFKSLEEKAIYNKFLAIWDIARASLISGALKRTGKGCPDVLNHVKPSDFLDWARSKEYEIPPELVEVTKELEYVEVVNNIQTIGEKTKSENTNEDKNEIAQTSLLKKPKRQDDWFEVINDMVNEYYSENKAIPSSTQAWNRLASSPPKGYSIKEEKRPKVESILTMPGFKNLGREAFNKRYEKYTKSEI